MLSSAVIVALDLVPVTYHDVRMRFFVCCNVMIVIQVFLRKVVWCYELIMREAIPCVWKRMDHPTNVESIILGRIEGIIVASVLTCSPVPGVWIPLWALFSYITFLQISPYPSRPTFSYLRRS